MSKRTIEERIQELQAKQRLELSRVKIRAQYDAIKPLLRKDAWFFEASDAVKVLTQMIADAQSMATKEKNLSGKVTP